MATFGEIINNLALGAGVSLRRNGDNTAFEAFTALDDTTTTADIPDSADKRYVTDAMLTKIGNTSGTNTGDQDLSGLALKNNVLQLNNTTAFTPTANYHPSTKKYVDDSIAAQGDGNVTNNGTSTNHALAKFDGTTGLLIQNGQVTETDIGDLENINQLGLEISPAFPATQEGYIYWSDTEKAPVATTDVSSAKVHLGRELVMKVLNNTGSTIAKGKVVYISGASLNRPEISLAVSTDETKSDCTIGFTMHSIADGDEGYIIKVGYLDGVDTSSGTDGERIYLSSTPGVWTTVKPETPEHIIKLGHIITANVSGKIFIDIFTHFHADEVNYDPAISGLIGTNVKTAIDELATFFKRIKSYRAVSTNTNVLTTDYRVNVTANNIALTLPTAVGNTNLDFHLRNGGNGTVRLNTVLSQTVNGNASGTITLSFQDNIHVSSNGTNWDII